jgi:rubrerythrin
LFFTFIVSNFNKNKEKKLKNPITALDAIKIAIKQEKDGYDYYKQAIKHVNENEVKNLLKKLADDEKEHEKTFNGILKSLKKQNNEIFDFEKDIAEFLSNLVKTVFSEKIQDLKKFMENVDSDLDIILHAIQNEKDTLLFFTQLKQIAKEQDSIKIFDKIINEERNHVILLTRAYSEMKNEILHNK